MLKKKVKKKPFFNFLIKIFQFWEIYKQLQFKRFFWKFFKNTHLRKSQPQLLKILWCSGFYNLPSIYYFFKKRLLLLKFFKFFKKKILKKNFLKGFQINIMYQNSLQLLKKKNLFSGKSGNFLLKFRKKILSQELFKVLRKKKKPWYVCFFKKFSFLKILLFKNFTKLCNLSLSKSFFIQLFQTFKSFSNLNFFYLWYFRVSNFYQICFFFFSFIHFIKFFLKKFFFINGVLCCNLFYSFYITVCFTVQVIWNIYFMLVFINFFKKLTPGFKKKDFSNGFTFFVEKFSTRNQKKNFLGDYYVLIRWKLKIYGMLNLAS